MLSSTWVTVTFIAVSLSVQVVPLEVSAVSPPSKINAGACTYNFEVWKPDENIIERIDKLEGGTGLMNATLTRDLLSLRLQVLAKVDELDNATALLQTKVKSLDTHHRTRHPQSMKYVPKKSEIDSIWNSVGAVTNRLERITSQMKKIKNEDGIDNLRSVVGDLKAEWIVMKRELQNIRADGDQSRKEQQQIGVTSVGMKQNVKGLQGDIETIKKKQEDLFDSVRKLSRSRDVSLKNSSYGMPYDSVARVESELANFENKIRNLHAIYNQLDKKMNSIIRTIEKGRKTMVHGNGSINEGVVPNMWSAFGKSVDQIAYPSTQRAAADTVEDRTVPRDCHDIYTSGQYLSGLYQIQPKNAQQLDHVYCEMINGTGWTVVQRRLEGLTNFTRGWLEYRYGFGNPYGEFWQGNDFLHLMTSQKQYILRIDLWDWQGTRRFAEYEFFEVGSEWDKYKLTISAYQGDAGDSLSYHNGMAFSTKDADNDLHREHCAAEMKSGWWFNGCFSSNLNGVYHKGWYTNRGSSFPDGIVWFTMKESEYYSAKKVEMKLRPKYL
ncbi:angiopoietin-related protein 7 [Octopus sinensis]|uniref:Angiopoietin-related protein 7 n=1 Tax=Octopus sinensis TaxID=2607531 RepID=A0A6P7U7M1_9MOLL|nr:angiopoietin-related protein 7 [Octopus sinensis]